MERVGQPGKESFEFMDKVFFYCLIAEVAYADYPFEWLQNAQTIVQEKNKILKSPEPLDGYKMGLMGQFQKRMADYVPDEKPYGERNKKNEYTGLHGGRQIKECTFEQMQALWIKRVNNGRTPVDESIRRKNMPKAAPKGMMGGLKSMAKDKLGKKNFTVMIPRYFVAVNKATKECLIAIRGTQNLSDCLADLKCATMPTACNQGMAQMAMQCAAIFICMDIYQQVKRLMTGSCFSPAQCNKITCVGHSLGAACASLLAVLLETPFENGGCGFTDKVKCYGYGCPPILNLNDPVDPRNKGSKNMPEEMSKNNFLKHTEDYITTVVNQHDIVPRMAPQNIAAYTWGSDNCSYIDELKLPIPLREKLMSKPKNEEKKEDDGNTEKKGGMFSKGMGSLKKMGSSMKDMTKGGGRTMIAFSWEVVDKGLMALSRQWGDYEFDNIWLPGKIYNISYEHKGWFDMSSLAKILDSTAKVAGDVLQNNKYANENMREIFPGIRVQEKKYLCLHQLPKNHPRICLMTGDTRMFSDHLMANPKAGSNGYIANLAELYYKCKDETKKDEVREVEEAINDDSLLAGAGCAACTIC
jgi:hypothetical protein